MNILLTSAGRRSYLVNYFKSAGPNQQVIVCNAIAESPAMYVADKSYRVPFVYETGYIEAISKICRKHRINYIFSLHDLDGPILSKNRKILESSGAKLVVPSYEIVSMSLDKFMMANFLNRYNIKTPKTWLSPEKFLKEFSEEDFPVIIKPRWGYGSNSLMKAWTPQEVLALHNYFEAHKNKLIIKYLGYHENEPSTIIQQFQKGIEYGLGVVNHINGTYAGSLMLKKIGMRSGETDAATTISDIALENIGRQLSKITKHPGLMDCDVIKIENDYYVLEINPRFGGQYPFSHMAGANVPAFLIGLNHKLVIPEDGKTFYKDINIIQK